MWCCLVGSEMCIRDREKRGDGSDDEHINFDQPYHIPERLIPLNQRQNINRLKQHFHAFTDQQNRHESICGSLWICPDHKVCKAKHPQESKKRHPIDDHLQSEETGCIERPGVIFTERCGHVNTTLSKDIMNARSMIMCTAAVFDRLEREGYSDSVPLPSRVIVESTRRHRRYLAGAHGSTLTGILLGRFAVAKTPVSP